MNLRDFDYKLPPELIAKYPTKQRTDSRLLCLSRKSGMLKHKQFYDIVNLLKPGDLLVLNDSKVIPARVYGRKITGGKVELLIERMLSDQQVLAHLRTSKSPALDDEIILSDGSRAILLARKQDLWHIQFLFKQPVLTWLAQHGHIPLPPYIDRSDEAMDKQRYQTVFAKYDGSVAAPTAGLHFQESLLQALRNKGIGIAFVTLHIGAGTFQPVRTEVISQHVMHAEYVQVSAHVCDLINQAKTAGQRVIAGGTTVVRSLETAGLSGKLVPYKGDTSIFIYPGYQFNVIDGLLTNFHLPKSSLLMLVSAFAGHSTIQRAYQHAIAKKYRFYSYGDAMLIL